MIELIDFKTYYTILGLGSIGALFTQMLSFIKAKKEIKVLLGKINNERDVDEDSGLKKAFAPQDKRLMERAENINKYITNIFISLLVAFVCVVVYLVGQNISVLFDNKYYFYSIAVVNYLSIILILMSMYINIGKIVWIYYKLIDISKN